MYNPNLCLSARFGRKIDLENFGMDVGRIPCPYVGILIPKRIGGSKSFMRNNPSFQSLKAHYGMMLNRRAKLAGGHQIGGRLTVDIHRIDV
jgi:hypothetical protein